MRIEPLDDDQVDLVRRMASEHPVYLAVFVRESAGGVSRSREPAMITGIGARDALHVIAECEEVAAIAPPLGRVPAR